jgi:hypothetical protein
MMSLLPFFQWSEQTVIGEALRSSLWLFPFVEAFHLAAFGVIGGTVLIVDLRLLGVALKGYPVSDLARDMRPWMIGSLVVMVISGTVLYLSEAQKLYYSDPFWIKMIALVLAVVVTFSVRTRIIAADQARLHPMWGKLIALISIVLWATVAWGGRWIGFSGLSTS